MSSKVLHNRTDDTNVIIRRSYGQSNNETHHGTDHQSHRQPHGGADRASDRAHDLAAYIIGADRVADVRSVPDPPMLHEL